MRPRRGRSRRVIFFGAVLALAACYTVHMDERQIRSTASIDLDCDESYVELETESSDRTDVARYTARGCGKVRTYECTTDEQGYVACQHPGHRGGGDDPAAAAVAGDVATAAVAAGAGCACAALLGSTGGGGGGGGSGGGSVPATPVRSR